MASTCVLAVWYMIVAIVPPVPWPRKKAVLGWSFFRVGMLMVWALPWF